MGRIPQRRSVWIVCLLMMCSAPALAGCGGTNVQRAPKPLPVLLKAQAALNDATGTFTHSVSGQGINTGGVCRLTSGPQRAYVTISGKGRPLSTVIVDNLTAAYLELPAVPGTQAPQARWLKSSGVNVQVFAIADVLDFAAYTNARQLSDVSEHGVALYHIVGVEPSGNSVDLYLRKDNYYPVRADIHHSATTVINITVTFAAVNSTLSIALPPASQVTG
jgi:hypothetical protein